MIVWGHSPHAPGPWSLLGPALLLTYTVSATGTTPAPPEITLDLVGRYEPTHNAVGRYQPTLETVGRYSPTIDFVGRYNAPED